MNQEYKELIKEVDKVIHQQKYINLNNRMLNLEGELTDPEIWLNSEKITRINKEIKFIENKLNRIAKLKNYQEDLETAITLKMDTDILRISKELTTLYNDIKNEQYFTGPLDHHNAILSIHAGAGGNDAQDWAGMVMAMYQTFAKNQGFEYKTISISSGQECGIKSVTMELIGENAYGILKEEAGVHRLVRISPFNSAKTRETSFALVEVIPDDLVQLIDNFEVKDKDLEWDYYMASGKGGQSVNTTYSAVRLTHKPTGIVLTCQNERSQQQNKQIAMKHLKNKLAQRKIEEEHSLKDKLRGEIHSPEWGNQIRNYVLHPYKLVKDVRSNFESSDVEDILIYANILPIIWSVKEAKMNRL